MGVTVTVLLDTLVPSMELDTVDTVDTLVPSTELDTVLTVDTVPMVSTVDTVDTVPMVSTVDTEDTVPMECMEELLQLHPQPLTDVILKPNARVTQNAVSEVTAVKTLTLMDVF